MQIEQLRNFLMIAKCGNISHAALELRISQPNLSRSISNLEQELGMPLFDRNPRSLPLTQAGRSLLEHARKIVELVDATPAMPQDDGQTGCIRIGAIPTIAPYLLPGFLKHFADGHPQAQLLVTEDVTTKLVDRLTHGELDLAIMAAPIHGKYLDVHPLFKEELYLVTNLQHPLYLSHRSGQQIDLAKLSAYPFIMLDQEHCLSEQITAFCQSKSFQPIHMERASQLATVQALVSLGHGISLVPDMASQHDHDQQRKYIRLKNPLPTRTIVMVSNSYRYQTLLLKSCLQQLKDYAEKWQKCKP